MPQLTQPLTLLQECQLGLCLPSQQCTQSKQPSPLNQLRLLGANEQAEQLESSIVQCLALNLRVAEGNMNGKFNLKQNYGRQSCQPTSG